MDTSAVILGSWKEANSMAHVFCPNGHDMWNGDGQPVVWAFRTGFFCDFMKEHPDCILAVKNQNTMMYIVVFLMFREKTWIAGIVMNVMGL